MSILLQPISYKKKIFKILFICLRYFYSNFFVCMVIFFIFFKGIHKTTTPASIFDDPDVTGKGTILSTLYIIVVLCSCTLLCVVIGVGVTVKDKLRCPCKMLSRESKFRKSSCNQKLTIRQNQTFKLRRKCELDPEGTLSCSSDDDNEVYFDRNSQTDHF